MGNHTTGQATTAVPDDMLAALKERGVRVVETGLQHGTITAVIDKVEYEITTLRIDTDHNGE
jgi:tRNA nucleotidyltransferase/poly(A) polymerase